ncbi:GAF domain-containing sensor histidine kinase [Gottfriedia acidiceleris]|uniref:GAF domain-containing sensor histidine kinase n=1 Tax=Gottfriedia acidiceleris TaxID=371036 RepID=UPI002F2656FE
MKKESFLLELQVLKEIAEILNEGTDLHSTLNCALAKLVQVTGLDTGWIFLIDKNRDYELVASHELPPALLNEEAKPMCNGDCWCVDKYNTGRLNKASNIMECKRLEDSIIHKWGETNGVTHHATVPLQAGEESFGLLNVAASNKLKFNQEELNLLGAVALQIGTAIKRIQLTEKVKEFELIQERNRLAKDLHDSVSQLLFSINVTAKAGANVSDNVKIKDTFNHIQQIAQEAQAEMKALIWQLRPQGIEKGIVSALINYGEMLGLKVISNVKGTTILPSKVEETLWRVGQEAFNNCRKHSGQNTIYLQLSISTKKVKMTIRDQGVGFICPKDVQIPTLGLKSMKERVESLKGSFLVESNLNKGTKITTNIPF